MYVSMKDMLQHASEHKYAVMAVNCINYEQAKAICQAAAEEKSPVIIDIAPRQMKVHAIPEVMVPMIKALAEPLDVPVALNLDHGAEFEDITRCLKAGYSSVMIDASSYEFEENIRRTQLVSALAHGYGASVEAELGHVGQAAAGDGRTADMYTNVGMAKEFVERTHCDCLAVAIGTAHGKYPEGFVPQLDFERLAELKEALQMPLVLHGGSGAGEENIRRVVELGINKINVCTDLFNYQRDKIDEELKTDPNTEYLFLEAHSYEKAKEYIKNYMRMIGSSGVYTFTHEGPEFE